MQTPQDATGDLPERPRAQPALRRTHEEDRRCRNQAGELCEGDVGAAAHGPGQDLKLTHRQEPGPARSGYYSIRPFRAGQLGLTVSG